MGCVLILSFWNRRNYSPRQETLSPGLTYIGAAGSYLKTANEEGTHIAQTMAGLNDGSSTLNDVRNALTSAKQIEGVGFADYLDHTNGHIPAELNSLAKDVDETHRLFGDATNEFLEYWTDQNTAHIFSGQRTMERCVKLMNSTISSMTSALQSASPR